MALSKRFVRTGQTWKFSKNNDPCELPRDYEAMQPMFFSTPPTFDDVVATLQEAEKFINRSP